MLKNELRIAFRNIKRRKLHSFINIFGMTVSLTAFILIMLWVQNELSYDRYNVNASRICRITTSIRDANGTLNMAMTAAPVADALTQLPQLENAVRLLPAGKNIVVSSGDRPFSETDCFYADSSLFKIFTLPLIAGDAGSALRNPYSVVLSETTARKYFGTVDAVGKTLKINWHGNVHEYLVTGVMSDTPHDSHFHMNLVASLSSIRPPALSTGWTSVEVYTYVLLARNASLRSLTAGLPSVIESHMDPDLAHFWSLKAEPLTGIHLHSHLLLEIEPNGSMESLLIFGTAAILILLIAVMNFVSLSTVRYADRVREVGVRRILGADRKSLILKFIGENLLPLIVALLLSVSAAEIAIPGFENFTGKSIHLTFGNLFVLLVVASVVCVVGIAFPAISLSSIRPVHGLNKRVMPTLGGARVRRVLSIVQFSIATALLICTFVINDQMHYVSSKDLGMNISNIVVIPLREPELQARFRVIKDEFLRLDGVRGVSATSGDPTNSNAINSLYYNDKSVLRVRSLAVDYDFVRTMGLHLVSGRAFSSDIPSDSTEAIIVNQAAEKKLRSMHLSNQVLQFRTFRSERKRNYVIGVVRDFNYRPLYYQTEPLVLYVQPADFRFLEVKIDPANETQTLSALKQTWDRIEPNYPFNYTFLDQDLASVYGSYRKTGDLFDAFSMLAVIISCLGLLGVAYHSAERRTKEIGIRKVLGSSVPEIVLLLDKEFMVMVLIAGAMAFPVSYLFVRSWLEDFAYRVPVSFLDFAGALLVVAGIVLVTTGYLAVKAAAANPIEALRYE